MKSLKIFSLIVLFVSLLIFVPGVGLADDSSDQGADKNCCRWTSGKTSVSDLSPEEKQKRLGFVVPDWYKEWWERAEKLTAPEGAKFDSVLDWRVHEGPYGTTGVSAVTDQRDCGSCWAFAGVAQLESHVKIYGEVEMDLSEQQVVSCKTYGYGCNGAWTELAYELFQETGSIKEDCMPYLADHWVPCTDDTCEKWAKISGYHAVSGDVNSIKNALLTGPVKSSMTVFDPFFGYTGGCWDSVVIPPPPTNHAVLIVGWDDGMCDGNGAWICKNSWGMWGDSGFFYIQYGASNIGSYVFQIDYIFHRPYVRIENYAVNDEAGGNGDGRADPGETLRLDFRLKNVWTDLGGVEVTVTADTDGVVITDDYTYFGDMDSKEILNNWLLDPMEFYLPEDFPARRVYFTFHVEGDSGGGVTYTADTTVELFVGRDVLLVDDDSGSGTYGNYESYYIQAFDSLRVVYDVWDKQAKGDYASSLSDYKVLVWYTGDHREDVFSQEDIDSLTSFLDDGGSLFLTSQSAVEALSASGETSDSIFLADYLHVGYDGTSSKLLIMGEAGDEVGDTLWIKPWDLSGANNQTSKDELVPDSEADTVLVYADGPGWIPTNFVAGSKFGNDYFRVVLFGFGFEALARGEFFGKLLSQPHFVMQRVLDWLKARPTINVIYPDGGEAWFVDQSYDILWECISFEDSVKIEYSTNNGDDWSTIVDTTTNDGVYSWTVPDTPSESCLIRISDVDNGIPFDVSDDCFSIMNYIPGDPNGDGLVNVADVVYLTTYLFLDGPPPQPLSAGDPNGDCVVNVADAVYLVTYLFADGPPPQPGCAR